MEELAIIETLEEEDKPSETEEETETAPESNESDTSEDTVENALDAYFEELKKGAGVQKIIAKAKEIRKKGESWKAAIKRASKLLKGKKKLSAEDYENFSTDELLEMLSSTIDILKKKKYPYPYPEKKAENEDEKTVEEEAKKKEKQPEVQSLDTDLLDILSSITEKLAKKKKYPYPEQQSSKELAKDFMKTIEKKDEQLEKMSKKIEQLEKNLEELSQKGIKKTKENLESNAATQRAYHFDKDGSISTDDYSPA